MTAITTTVPSQISLGTSIDLGFTAKEMHVTASEEPVWGSKLTKLSLIFFSGVTDNIYHPTDLYSRGSEANLLNYFMCCFLFFSPVKTPTSS